MPKKKPDRLILTDFEQQRQTTKITGFGSQNDKTDTLCVWMPSCRTLPTPHMRTQYNKTPSTLPSLLLKYVRRYIGRRHERREL